MPSTSVNHPPVSNIHQFANDFLTAGFAAVISKTAVAPLERTKLLLQLQDASGTIAASRRYNGIVDVLRRVHKEQGFLSFWRGNGTNMVRYLPTHALNFAFKDLYKKFFFNSRYAKDRDVWKTFGLNLLAGGLAGSTTSIFVYPLDFVRTRLATDIGKGNNREFTGMYDVFKKTWKSDGLIGMYRGFIAYVVGIFIFKACYFGLYDQAKLVLGDDLSFFWSFVVAQGVVTTTSLVLYPSDTIRRRLMMQSGRKERLYTGYLDYWKKEGLRGCYKGFGVNILRSTGGALLLAFYDGMRKNIHRM